MASSSNDSEEPPASHQRDESNERSYDDSDVEAALVANAEQRIPENMSESIPMIADGREMESPEVMFDGSSESALGSEADDEPAMDSISRHGVDLDGPERNAEREIIFENVIVGESYDSALEAKFEALFHAKLESRIESQIESKIASRFASTAIHSAPITTDEVLPPNEDTKQDTEGKSSSDRDAFARIPERTDFVKETNERKFPLEKYPRDSYAFIALGPKKKLPFGFGCLVFFLQFSLLSLMFFSKTFLFKLSWRPLGQNEDLDNPDQDKDTFNGGAFIPANTSVIVRLTQILAIVVFMLFGGDSLTDFTKAVMHFPVATNCSKFGWLRFACILRGLQGLLGILTAILLVVTATDVIDIVLNFTAVHYISNFDDVAFELAESVHFGKALKKEADNIKNKYLPDCILKWKNSLCYHYLYLIIVGILGSLFMAITIVIIVMGERNDVWTTRIFRAEFEGGNLQQFGGCFKASDIEHHRRIAYQGYRLKDNVTATLSYCQTTHEWIFHKEGPDADPCEVTDNILARSSMTFSFDISSVFDAPWYSQWNKPIAVSFVDNEKNTANESFFFCGAYPNDGRCDIDLNNFNYQYDGGDCCASTCSQPEICGKNSFESVFGITNSTGFGFPSCRDPDVVSGQSQVEITIDEITDRNNTNKTHNPILKIACQRDQTQRQIFSAHLIEAMEGKAEMIGIDIGSKCSVQVEMEARDDVDSDYAETSDFGEIVIDDSMHANISFVVKFHVVQVSVEAGDTVLRNLETYKGSTSEENEFIVYPNKFLSELELLKYFIELSAGTIPSEIGLLTSLANLDFFGSNLIGSIPTEIGLLEKSLTYLDFEDNKLSGIIPSEIGLLNKSLSALDLEENELSGTIPTEIGLLVSLTYLDLSLNELTGPIPSEIGQLTSLTLLSFRTNSLTGTLPSEISLMTSLRRLNLGENELTGPIPTEVAEMASLTSLVLDTNQFDGPIPVEIQKLQSVQLTKYDFENCCQYDNEGFSLSDIEGLIPTEIGRLISEINIDLDKKQLSGTIPTEIGLLTSATALTIEENKLSGSIPTEIGLLNISLTTLDLEDNMLTGSIPSEIGLLTSLTYLDLSANNFTGTIPSEVRRLTSLALLSFRTNNLTGPIPTEIDQMKSLTRLNFGENQLTGSIPNVIATMTSLTSLALDNNKLDGPIPSDIQKLTSTQLKKYNFDDCCPNRPESSNEEPTTRGVSGDHKLRTKEEITDVKIAARAMDSLITPLKTNSSDWQAQLTMIKLTRG